MGHLSYWKNRLGKKPLSEISTPLIAQCRDELSRETTVRGKIRSQSTVNRYLAALSSVLSIASNEWEWIELNPVLKVKNIKNPRGEFAFFQMKKGRPSLMLVETLTVRDYF